MQVYSGMPMQPFSDPETHRIIGAAMAVHTELGCGFLEAVYRAALAIEFERAGVAFVPQVLLPISYKDRPLPLRYRVDFVCCGDVIVETKALDVLTSRDEAQLLNYMKAAGVRRGLLLNFGATSLRTSAECGTGRGPRRRA